MGRALYGGEGGGGAQKGCMGCWRSVAVEKDKGSTLGSIPTAAPGAQRPQPHTVGPKGGGERGDGEAECVHTHCTRTRAHTWL